MNQVMRFEKHIRDWEEMAADPLWAILNRKRDWDVEQFFASGEGDSHDLLAAAQQLGLPQERFRALDFGCGVGRVTRAISRVFKECWGVDISQSMLDLAEKYNPQCHFHLIRRNDLHDFPDCHFDLVYSLIVLQHQPTPRIIEDYLCEFVRVLRPGGLLAFQLPSSMPFRYRLAPRRRAYHLLSAIGFRAEHLLRWKLFPMRMTALDIEQVRKTIERSGGKFLLSKPHPGSGPIPSRMYYCTKGRS